MVYHKGDDLEDDFMPDETVALSEDEGFGSLVGVQDDVGTLLSADEDEKAGVKSPSERTRAPSEEKKRKRRKKEKERKEKECPPPTSQRCSRVPDASRSPTEKKT
jgi:protein CMS1